MPIQATLSAADEVFLSVIVAGELYFGAAKSGRPEANRAVIDNFMRDRAVLPCNPEVAREYGRVKAVLKAQGTPVPENDVWIAATALCHGLTLLSRDHHFRVFAGLNAIGW